ncbi:twin transmembrane helix small protein [Aquipseudomonas alcaligenes]|uniref:twin transmembrane helix small protein n=1 Tax=Aquipseudomonas alcaligenes TaxID=43263 RepID=UPI00077FF103|nr:twin transmembrane helix small protein [Pseudomonas alcaligenes]AMR65262.1 MFS transporter [Pseudomonas alcaligenes]
MLKAAIILLLLATLVSLFSGLFFLVRDEGRGLRVVNSLSVRVVLTAITVALIAWGLYSGQLVSHVTW